MLAKPGTNPNQTQEGSLQCTTQLVVNADLPYLEKLHKNAFSYMGDESHIGALWKSTVDQIQYGFALLARSSSGVDLGFAHAIDLSKEGHLRMGTVQQLRFIRSRAAELLKRLYRNSSIGKPPANRASVVEFFGQPQDVPSGTSALWYLSTLAIKEDVRRRGVGQRLIQDVEKQILSYDKSKAAVVILHANSGTGSEELFTKSGYTRLARVSNPHPNVAWATMMSKTISLT